MYYITIYENNTLMYVKNLSKEISDKLKKVFSFWAVKTQIQAYKGCLLNYC